MSLSVTGRLADGGRVARRKAILKRLIEIVGGVWSGQLHRHLCDPAALVPRPREFLSSGRPVSIGSGDCGGSIGSAAANLVDAHLTGEAIVETDDYHAEVEQVGDDREQGRFLTAML